MIQRQPKHRSVHNWFLQLRLLSWFYESRAANFYQGPSRREEFESVVDERCGSPPVFREDERGSLAEQWATGIADAGGGDFAQCFGEVVCERSVSAACSVASRFPLVSRAEIVQTLSP
jgi:hypothetical protein